MPEQLKKIFFTTSSINEIGDTIQRFYPDFDKNKFVELIFDEGWETMELKEKMRHTTQCLHKTLPRSYKEALEILKKAAPFVKGFEAMSLPDFVARKRGQARKESYLSRRFFLYILNDNHIYTKRRPYIYDTTTLYIHRKL